MTDKRKEALEALDKLRDLALQYDPDDPAYSNGDTIINCWSEIKAALSPKKYDCKTCGWENKFSGSNAVKALKIHHRDMCKGETVTIPRDVLEGMRETISSLQTQIYELGGTPKRTEKGE